MQLSDEKDSELLETLFKEKGFAPNKSQLKAIKHIEGPLFLTAGSGSGKTRVLLWRTERRKMGRGRMQGKGILNDAYLRICRFKGQNIPVFY